MNEIEKAIKALKEHHRSMKIFIDNAPDGAYTHSEMLCDAEEIAVNALSEKLEREKNEPLTLDELRKMDGQPVYLAIADGVYGLVDWVDQEVTLPRGMSLSITTAVFQGCVYRHPLNVQEPKE